VKIFIQKIYRRVLTINLLQHRYDRRVRLQYRGTCDPNEAVCTCFPEFLRRAIATPSSKQFLTAPGSQSLEKKANVAILTSCNASRDLFRSPIFVRVPKAGTDRLHTAYMRFLGFARFDSANASIRRKWNAVTLGHDRLTGKWCPPGTVHCPACALCKKTSVCLFFIFIVQCANIARSMANVYRCINPLL
jgi:hypothetical protein